MFSNFMKFKEGRYDTVSDEVDFHLQHVLHITESYACKGSIGATLMHPMRRQNCAGELHLNFYNI